MDNDKAMLRAVVQWCDTHHDEAEKKRLPAREFREMLKRENLTRRQSDWIRDVYDRIFDEPDYQNTWSSGAVAKGRDVPTPEVLLKRPLKPPGR
jgi:hypothetical protein